MALNFIDRYSTVLSGAYTAGGATLSVISTTGLPQGAVDFYIIVQAETTNAEEVFHITNIAGTVLTVVGAQAGTSANSHSSGAVVVGSVMTAAAYSSMLNNLNSMTITPLLTTSYSNPGGSGDRTSTIVITDTGNLWDRGSTAYGLIHNYDNGECLFFGGMTVDSAHWIRFDFGIPYIISEITYYGQFADSDLTHYHGVWQWQGSNDGLVDSDDVSASG